MITTTQKTALGLSVAFMLYANLLGGGSAARLNVYEMFPTAFSPTPYTFSVWAPIFLGCIALTVYLCFVPEGQTKLPGSLVGWVAAAFVFTGLTAYTPIGFSNLLVTSVLICLSIAYWQSVGLDSSSAGIRWCVRIPIVIFVTWTLVATILNACQWSVSKGWNVGPVEAAFLIGFASLVGITIVLRYREIACALVLIWAFWGIVAARPEERLLLIAAVLGTAFLLTALIYARLTNSSNLGNA